MRAVGGGAGACWARWRVYRDLVTSERMEALSVFSQWRSDFSRSSCIEIRRRRAPPPGCGSACAARAASRRRPRRRRCRRAARRRRRAKLLHRGAADRCSIDTDAASCATGCAYTAAAAPGTSSPPPPPPPRRLRVRKPRGRRPGHGLRERGRRPRRRRRGRRAGAAPPPGQVGLDLRILHRVRERRVRRRLRLLRVHRRVWAAVGIHRWRRERCAGPRIGRWMAASSSRRRRRTIHHVMRRTRSHVMRRRVGRESLFFGAVSKIADATQAAAQGRGRRGRRAALRPPAEQKNCAKTAQAAAEGRGGRRGRRGASTEARPSRRSRFRPDAFASGAKSSAASGAGAVRRRRGS